MSQEEQHALVIAAAVKATADFRLDIVEKLGDLKSSVDVLCATNKQIVAHQERVNGSISKLYERSEENKSGLVKNEKDLLEHRMTCSAIGTINEVERRIETGDHPGSKDVREKLEKFNLVVAAQASAEQTSNKWRHNLLYPIIKWAVILLLALGAFQARDMLKLMGK